MSRGVTNEIREVRLALVCYGGVSLAVYMHGITKELRKLVVASRAFDHDATVNPFHTAEDATERAYFDAIAGLARSGAPVRFVIDVISGTSAGGINGVCLATALARNGDDAVLRDLWLDKGDIGGLLNAPKRPWLSWRLAAVSRRLVFKARSSYTPLKGDDMARWLFGALAGIGPEDGAPGSGAPSAEDLVPPDSNLRLVVTTTDLRGYDLLVESGTGDPPLHDRNYRHVFEFDHQPGGLSNFEARDTPALALACRCTSSIPGAFPAVRLGDFVEQIGQSPSGALDHIVGTYFTNYADASVKATMTEFVDGGVLDNAPFDRALDVIVQQRAQTEVVRHLIYLEPDPGADPAPGAGVPSAPPAEPGWLTTAWDAVAKVSRHEPLLQQLLRLRNLNERVATIGAIADQQMDAVQHLVDDDVQASGRTAGPLHALSFDDMAAVARRLHSVAATQTALTLPTYVRLKLQDATAHLSAAIARANHYHADSSQAAFVRLALGAWLGGQPAFVDPQGDRAGRLLDQIDVGYRDRRLRFVLQGVNALYADSGPTAPRRGSIDTLKRALWDRLEPLGDASAHVVSALPPVATAVFAPKALTTATLGRDPAGFALEQHASICALVEGYGSALVPRVTTTNADLWSTFVELTEGWDDSVRRPLSVRYVAFPIWDQLLFPIVALSATPQFSQIQPTRFSPDRATLLKSPDVPGKLRGTGFHHFAAFFDRSWRENDYLWGRLDGAELILRLIAGLDASAPGLDPSTARDAFRAVLRSEDGLTSTAALRVDLHKQIAALAQ